MLLVTNRLAYIENDGNAFFCCGQILTEPCPTGIESEREACWLRQLGWLTEDAGADTFCACKSRVFEILIVSSSERGGGRSFRTSA